MSEFEKICQLVKTEIAKGDDFVLVVLGPTTSGKTALAVALALKEGGEIINADSKQLFKGFNIGTAKATESEKKLVKHHLLDVLDPGEEITVQGYQKKAYEVIDEILDRSALPIMVGGSMLYIDAVCDGYDFAGARPDHVLREKLEDEYDVDNGQSLAKRVGMIDPELEDPTYIMNKQRYLRQCETVLTLGKKRDPRSKPKYKCLKIGLQAPKDWLYRRINERVANMMDAGLIGEIIELLERDVPKDAQAMMAHGYRHIIDFLDNKITEATAVEKMKQDTRKYAKRQMTWWKRDKSIKWFAADKLSEESYE